MNDVGRRETSPPLFERGDDGAHRLKDSAPAFRFEPPRKQERPDRHPGGLQRPFRERQLQLVPQFEIVPGVTSR